MLISAVACCTGSRRTNEDTFYLNGSFRTAAALDDRISVNDCAEPAVFMVCDGMGGLVDGGGASSLAADMISEQASDILAAADTANAMEHCLRSVHKAICEKAMSSGSPMGAAIVLAVIREDELYIANVGDCRAYILRGGRLSQLSVDHTIAQSLREMGLPEKDNSQLTQFLGMEEDEFIMEPFCARVPFMSGHLLLLCSDGISQRHRPSDIEQILTACEGPRDVAITLARMTERSQDNATAIVVKKV